MLQEYERGRDPVIAMTVLLAIRWGIEAWHDEIKSSTFLSCFEKALYSEQENTPIIETEGIVNDYAQLRSVPAIRGLMGSDTFLNPSEEIAVDDVTTIDERILSEFNATPVEYTHTLSSPSGRAAMSVRGTAR
jgi:hypothetical protein